MCWKCQNVADPPDLPVPIYELSAEPLVKQSRRLDPIMEEVGPSPPPDPSVPVKMLVENGEDTPTFDKQILVTAYLQLEQLSLNTSEISLWYPRVENSMRRF